MNQVKPKVLPIFLSVAGAAGVVATAIVAAKEESKITDNISSTASKKDKIKYFLNTRKKTLLVAAGTIGCVTAGTILSAKAEISAMTTAVAALASGKRLYNKLPENIKKDIMKQMSLEDYDRQKPVVKEGNVLVWHPVCGYFDCKETELLKALDRLKDKLGKNSEDPRDQTIWAIFMIDFMKDIKDCNFDDTLPDLEDHGWCVDYIPDAIDLPSIHYYLDECVAKDGTHYLELSFDLEPYIPDKDGYPLNTPDSGELAESKKFGESED